MLYDHVKDEFVPDEIESHFKACTESLEEIVAAAFNGGASQTRSNVSDVSAHVFSSASESVSPGKKKYCPPPFRTGGKKEPSGSVVNL